MELRTPGIEEYDEILELWDRCDITYRPDGRDSREHVASELNESPEYWIAAYEDGDLVGIVVGSDDGRKGWVNRLAVHPRYRREGIASSLLEALESAFEDNGLRVFAALIEDNNDRSQAFFEAFEYDDSSIVYYSKRENEFV